MGRARVASSTTARRGTTAGWRLAVGPGGSRAARSDYPGRLIADHKWLDFAGIPQVRNVVRLKLDDVFVPLSATRELPEGSRALSDPGCFISTFSLLIELSRRELTGKAGPGPVLTLPVSGSFPQRRERSIRMPGSGRSVT